MTKTPGRLGSRRILCAVAVAWLIFTSSFCLGQETTTPWPQFQFSPAHTGFNPYEHAIGPKSVRFLKSAWTLTTGGPINGGVAEANGVIYFGTQLDNKLYAVDENTGAVKWIFPTNGYVFSSPAVNNGVVYVSSDGFEVADVYAVDAATGVQKWDYHITDTYGFLTDPVVSNGAVYVATQAISAPTRVYALNASTGAAIWQQTTTGDVQFPPALANNMLYVTGADGVLYALNASTGTVQWNFSTGGNLNGPVVAGGAVFVGAGVGNTDTLYALNGKTGAVIWTFVVTNNRTVDFTSGAIAGGVIYVSSGDEIAGATYAVDARSGSLRWKKTLSCCILNTAAVANGVAYFPYSNYILAVDTQTGTLLWKSPATFSAVYSSATVVNGMLFFGSTDSNLYAFRLSRTGE